MDNLGGSPLENSGVYVVLAMLHESSGQHELAKMHAMKAVDCHDLHTGTRLENSKNEADKAQYAKPFPPDQAPPAIGRFDPETAFEKIGNNYRPSVVTFDKFNGIQQLIPEIPVPLVMWPLTEYQPLFQAQIRSDWDSAMVKLFKATRTAIQSKDSNFFLRFSGFDTHNQLFNYYRAIFDCIGGQKSTYQLLSLVQLTADAYNMELSQFASTKNAISQRASDVGSIPGLVHANEIAALSMRAGKLGKAVPEISTDLTTPMGLADVYQHVEGSLRRNPNLQAHGAIMQSQAPAGFYFACNGCHRKVKDPTTHRCAPNPNNNTNNHNNNNRGRGSNRGRGRGQRGASNAPGGLPPYNSPAARDGFSGSCFGPSLRFASAVLRPSAWLAFVSAATWQPMGPDARFDVAGSHVQAPSCCVVFSCIFAISIFSCAHVSLSAGDGLLLAPKRYTYY